jgi:hypothetical protein
MRLVYYFLHEVHLITFCHIENNVKRTYVIQFILSVAIRFVWNIYCGIISKYNNKQ